MKVLVAEDDAVSRILTTRTLENLGHLCIVARDGEEAWELWQKDTSVDVIVSDWMMAEMDGIELCRRVRATSDSYPYFILLTTFSDREHRLAGLGAGADDYLTKPLDRREFEARLGTAGRLSEMRRRLSGTEATSVRRLDEELEVLSDRVKRYGHRYCVLLCDIELASGTEREDTMRRFARFLRENLRTGDTCHRCEDERFLIVLPEQTPDTARVVAKRLIRDADSPTVGVGIAEMSRQGARDGEELLRAACSDLSR